jgi:dUTP pyrophosphatase
MKIRFKKLSRNAVTPSYAKPGDAGMDMTSVTHLTDTANQTVNYHTGIAVEIPKGYVGSPYIRQI